MSLDTMKKGLRFAGALALGAAGGVAAAGASEDGVALDVSAAGFSLDVVAALATGIATWDRQEATKWAVALGTA
jgi:hypothetical protein